MEGGETSNWPVEQLIRSITESRQVEMLVLTPLSQTQLLLDLEFLLEHADAEEAHEMTARRLYAWDLELTDTDVLELLGGHARGRARSEPPRGDVPLEYVLPDAGRSYVLISGPLQFRGGTHGLIRVRYYWGPEDGMLKYYHCELRGGELRIIALHHGPVS
jgi:hypothetical protein